MSFPKLAQSEFGSEYLAEVNATTHQTMISSSTYNFEVNSVKLIEHSKDSSVPSPRSGHRIVCDESDLFVLGGYSNVGEFNNGSPHLYDELWKYNYAQNSWTKLETSGPFPKELASHSLVLRNDLLIAYGGTKVPFGSGASNKVHLCNLKTLEWQVMETTGESPPPLYGQAAYLFGSSFFVCGGTDGINYNMDIYKLDLESRHWCAVFISKGDGGGEEPEHRYRHELAMHGETIFVLGGGTSSGVHRCIGLGFENIDGFHLGAKKWMTHKCRSTAKCNVTGDSIYPSPRLAHGCIQYGDNVWISGGRNGDTIYGDIWKLQLPTLTWTRFPAHTKHLGLLEPPFTFSVLPKNVHFHDMSVTPAGCAYVFGGLKDKYYTERINDLSKFWVEIPSLKEICWETLLDTLPNLTKIKHDRLLEWIPREFISRFPCTPTSITRL